MPIKIADNLPARSILENENIFIISQNRALTQDIRPIKIVILNLMPIKTTTETQILRCLSNTPLQIEIDLLQTQTYESKHTPHQHLLSFYNTFDEIRGKKYDGMIITGAPVEIMDFEEVEYWTELCDIMQWSKTHVFSTFHICWGAQAGLYYHHGIPKHRLFKKLSGIYKHKITVANHNLFRGFDDDFYAPHSRNTEILSQDILKQSELEIMSVSQDAGIYIIRNKNDRNFYVMGHPEYDKYTLKDEYERDTLKGLNDCIPQNYFKNNNPNADININWKGHGHLLYTNWLNYFVYQSTPYDIDSVGEELIK